MKILIIYRLVPRTCHLKPKLRRRGPSIQTSPTELPNTPTGLIRTLGKDNNHNHNTFSHDYISDIRFKFIKS